MESFLRRNWKISEVTLLLFGENFLESELPAGRNRESACLKSTTVNNNITIRVISLVFVLLLPFFLNLKGFREYRNQQAQCCVLSL